MANCIADVKKGGFNQPTWFVVVWTCMDNKNPEYLRNESNRSKGWNQLWHFALVDQMALSLSDSLIISSIESSDLDLEHCPHGYEVFQKLLVKAMRPILKHHFYEKWVACQGKPKLECRVGFTTVPVSHSCFDAGPVGIDLACISMCATGTIIVFSL